MKTLSHCPAPIVSVFTYLGVLMFRRRWWLFGEMISDEGFTIKFTKKNALLYETDGKMMIVRTDGNFPEMDVFHSSMQHWSGDNSLIDGKTD